MGVTAEYTSASARCTGSKSMRLAVGGFQHETNTFAPIEATYEDFVAPDAWPGLVRGADLIDAVRGINLPAAGFILEALAARHTIVPLTWCSATPSAHVTRDAYERIAGMLVEDVANAGHIDAVYLDLHGAMVAEHIDDADGELLRRVRAAIGPHVPLIASLDFHANVSRLMVEQASALVAYRTYPHTDMAVSGERALRVLRDANGWPLARAFHALPFLIPLTSQCTLVPPLSSVVDEIAHLETGLVHSLNFTPGFAAADVPECGPAVFAYGEDAAKVTQAAERVRDLVCEHEHGFKLDVYSIDSALRELERAPAVAGRPIVLADTQDNPGGGGTSDTTSLLKALIAHRAERVLAGVLCDALAAARAHEAGIGAQLDLELGGHAGPVGETPIPARFTVVALGDGRFTATGPFYAGSRMDLGPMAILRIADIYIAVSSRKQQAADRAMFHHLNVDPRDFALLVLKSSVHFRADFGPLASRVLVVAAPGANVADPALLPFKKLRSGMRVAGGARPIA
jgi:microcystin degradation protein MlrC